MEDLFQTEKKPITQADRDQLGSDLAKVDITIKGLKEEKADVNRSFRVKIRQLEDQSHTLSRQLDSGEVEHRFAVEEVSDDARLKVRVVRKDTGAEVSVRPMNEAEKLAAQKRKQPDLFDGERDPDRPPARRSGVVAKAAKGKPAKRRNGKGS